MTTSKYFLTTLLIICALIGSGCSAKYVGKTYDGPELPDTEVGTVKFNNLKKLFNNQKVIPCKLDGVRIDADSNQSISVKAGKHALLFMYDGKGPLMTVEWTFNVEARHKYLVSFPEEQSIGSISMWLEDLSAGQKVTDITSSPLKGVFTCF
jgi:hypothetical protein